MIRLSRMRGFSGNVMGWWYFGLLVVGLYVGLKAIEPARYNSNIVFTFTFEYENQKGLETVTKANLQDIKR
jgi:hypothetical protein